MSEHSSHIIKAGYDKDSSFYKAKSLINQRKYSEAVLYLKIASQLGNAEAMYQYGQLFLLGLGVEKNSSHLMYCMEKSAELKNGTYDKGSSPAPFGARDDLFIILTF